MSEREFKVGDRVKVRGWGVSPSGRHQYWFTGEERKILQVMSSTRAVTVTTDHRMADVHLCQCELVEPAKPKVGDEVEVDAVVLQTTFGDGHVVRTLTSQFPPGTKLKLKAEVVEVSE